MKSPLLIAVAVALCSVGQSQPTSPAAVSGSNNSFNDAAYGVSVSYPLGWVVRNAQRWGKNNSENTVFFAPPPPSRARPSMYYQMFSPSAPKPAPDKIEAYLRNNAASKERSRIASGLSDYNNVPESFEFRQIAGRPGASYFAVYSLRGQIMEEYFIRIVGETGYVMFFVQGPAADVSSIRATVDRMAETVQVP